MRWIQARWRERAQRWEWLPCRRIDGKLVWGSSYPTQEEAFEAAKRMPEEHARHERIGDLTFGGACDKANQQLIADGGSEHTRTGYVSRFGRWFDILAKDALVSEITSEDIEYFKLQRREKHGVASATIKKDLVVMQRVFDIAGLTGEHNPVRGVRRPKPIDPDRPFLSMKQVAEILDKIRASKKPEREWHAVVIAFLALTGMRAYELEHLRRKNVETLEDGSCCVVLQGEKGKRMRRVYIAEGSAWIAHAFVKEAVSAPPIAPATIATICKRWKRDLDLPHLSGRVLRRTFATEMDQHVSLRYLQEMMGHAQITTTQKYVGLDQQRARAAAGQLHLSLAGTDRSAPPAPDQSSAGG
ncbi:MAG: tyrosine-type recombinase/integrase [Planctomycetota bacterium]